MKFRNSYNNRRSRGAVIAETAASMALFLPVIVTIVFVALEVSYAYLIKSALSEAAREASRDLAIAYGLGQITVTNNQGNRAQENQYAFDRIRIYGIINDSIQFSDPVWNTNDPNGVNTVTATVTFLSGHTNGGSTLPRFPYPDPLKLGNNFTLTGTASYRLN